MTAAVIRADARCLPLPDASVDLIVTSPPYWVQRDYRDNGQSMRGQIGSEPTLQQWLAVMVDCTREWARVLKPTGNMFVNLGDKMLAKRLLLLPERYVTAVADQLGLIVRRDIVWHKVNGLPESVTDRCRSSHEYLFHLVRQPRYYAAVDEIREPQTSTAENRSHLGKDPRGQKWAAAGSEHIEGRHVRTLHPLGKLPGSVWSIPSQPLQVPPHLGVDHFAAFPLELPRRCILGWSPPGVCTGCGEGRRPAVDKVLAVNHLQRNAHLPGSVNGQPRWNVPVGADRVVGTTSATITGYACACPVPDAPTRPAIILDPFAGTGTTMLAASALGRVGVGVDLSADYCRLARWRTRDRGEIAKALQVPKPPPIMDGQEALFPL